MMRAVIPVTAFVALAVCAPYPQRELKPRLDISAPGGINISTGNDIGDLAGFSPIEDGFLEGDSDTGGGGENGETAGAVANGLTGGGSTSGSTSNGTQGSTSSFCSLSSCTSGAQSGNQNNTSSSTSSSSGSLLGNGASGNNVSVINGPIIGKPGRLIRKALELMGLVEATKSAPIALDT